MSSATLVAVLCHPRNPHHLSSIILYIVTKINSKHFNTLVGLHITAVPKQKSHNVQYAMYVFFLFFSNVRKIPGQYVTYLHESVCPLSSLGTTQGMWHHLTSFL